MKQSQIKSVITGVGGYLPVHRVHNSELPAHLETSHEWIFERTGIAARHIAADDQLTSDLGYEAALRALADAGQAAEDIDLIICATSSPDRTFPATAVRIQALLGAKNAAAFDVQAVCAGFVYALTIAHQFITTGSVKRVLVIGAETFTRLLDWNDRGTCVLFGDGAGAVLVEAAQNTDRGIINAVLKSEGDLEGILHMTGGPSLTKDTGVACMNGREVYRHATQKMAQVVLDVLKDTGYTLDDINWLVPHQANRRIMTAVAQNLGIPLERVIVSIEEQANTSAASIPLALAHGIEQGMLKTGDLVVLNGLGAGLAWGAVLLRL